MRMFFFIFSENLIFWEYVCDVFYAETVPWNKMHFTCIFEQYVWFYKK